MTRDEWFRRTTWSQADAAEFQARLARSRGIAGKSQYLRIQAWTLAATGDVKLSLDALGLLQQLFREYPEDAELSAAHLLAAQCHERVGDLATALEHLERSLDAQALYPNRDTNVRLEYPWFVARHGVTGHFDQALGVLDHAHLAFPVAIFKAEAARALIAHARGDSAAAKHAMAALEVAGLEKSQFPRHPRLGLVAGEHASVVAQLQAITSA